MLETTVRLHYSGSVPVQVDGFPTGCDRSRDGAIHLFPRSNVELTEAEWGWIQSDVPALAAHLVPAPILPPAGPAPEVARVAAPEADAVATPTPIPVPQKKTWGSKRAEGQPEERTDPVG